MLAWGVVPGEGIHGVCVGKLKQAASVTLLLPSLPSLPSTVAEWLPPHRMGSHRCFPGRQLDGNQSQ